MMAKDYAEIKKNAEELIDSIEALNREAICFKEAKLSLDEAAGAIFEASESLIDVVENSSEILDEVKSVSTEETLAEMRESAIRIQEACASIDESNNKAVQAIDRKFKIMGAISIGCSIIALILAFIH